MSTPKRTPISFSSLKPLPNHPTLSHSDGPEISKDGAHLSHTNGKSDWWHTPTEWRSSGPVLGVEVPKETLEREGGWSVGVSLKGDWHDQSDASWVKTGIEFTESKPWLSAVITNPFSDWSLLPFPSTPPTSGFSSFKISRTDTFIRVYTELNGEWTMIREVCNFVPVDGGVGAEVKVWVGVMGCSPKGEGCKVEFKDLWIE